MTTIKNKNLKKRAMSLAEKRDIPGAIMLFRRILKNNKQDADANFMLGALYGMQEQYQEALQYSTMAVNLSQNFAPALFNLALAYGKLEQPEKAIPLYKKVLALEPTHEQALYDIGYLHLTEGEYTKAEEYLLKHLAKNPCNASAHFYLAQAYDSLGSTNSAQHEYERAANIDSSNIDYLLQLGHFYHQAKGNLEQAEDCFTKVLRLDHGNIDAISGIALILEKKSDFDEAMRLIEPLIAQEALHATLGFAYYSIARHFGETSDAIIYLERIVSQHNIKGNTRLAQRALAQAYEEQGRYDDAFHYFTAANRSDNKDVFEEDTKTFITTSIALFDRTFFEKKHTPASNSAIPIFIVGMPRSGTTLVEQILSSHSRVHGGGEINGINEITNISHFSHTTGNQYPQSLKNGIPENMRKAAEAYIGKLRRISPSSLRVTNKMPHNFQHMGLISVLFPNAKIIHCKRNPLDNCLSIYCRQFNESHGYAKDLKKLGEYHRLYQLLMKHWEKVLPIPIFNIQYEELVANQETVSKDLIHFCGLDWEDSCLQFHNNKRIVHTFSYDQVRKPMYTSSLGKWKHYEKYLEPLIEALGLDIDDLHNKTDYIRY